MSFLEQCLLETMSLGAMSFLEQCLLGTESLRTMSPLEKYLPETVSLGTKFLGILSLGTLYQHPF